MNDLSYFFNFPASFSYFYCLNSKILKKSIMKNLKGIILTMALAGIFAGQVFAQAATPATPDDQTAKQTTTQVQACGKFVDNNNDGICDNREAKPCKEGKGANFVDANKDGICDHRADGNCSQNNQNCCKGQGNCCGKGMGKQHRHGCGGHSGCQKTQDRK